MSNTHKHMVWRGVPLSKLDAWTQVFNASREGINLSAPCPVCGARALHRYYQIGRPINRTIGEHRFIAEGASWEWCSICRSYEHGRALVPDWWLPTLVVDEAKLTAEPEILEEALHNRS